MTATRATLTSKKTPYRVDHSAWTGLIWREAWHSPVTTRQITQL